MTPDHPTRARLQDAALLLFRERGYDTRVLPSTSPAYTLAFEEKVARWQAAGIGPAAQALS